jgi:type IV pilus modification protein PilV
MDKKGFTLIEMLIGLVLLAVGLLAIAGMQIKSVKGNSFSGNMTQASILAQDRLEALRQRDFNHTDLDVGSHSEGTIAGTMFSRGYNVALIPGTTMRSITVTVRWTDTSSHSVSFTTVRAEN